MKVAPSICVNRNHAILVSPVKQRIKGAISLQGIKLNCQLAYWVWPTWIFSHLTFAQVKPQDSTAVICFSQTQFECRKGRAGQVSHREKHVWFHAVIMLLCFLSFCLSYRDWCKQQTLTTKISHYILMFE